MKVLFALGIALAVLMAGCAGGEKQQSAQAAPPPTEFSLPSAPFPYTAHYSVSEGKEAFTKTVWRKGTAARMDMELAPGAAFSLYFVQGRGYSCSSVSGRQECFEIRAEVPQQSASGLFGIPDYSSGKEIGPVEIGGGVGRCFLFPYTAASKRKMCFTDRNVVAYDEYNATSSTSHVEYLTSIDYSADDSAFVLPAVPQAPPPSQGKNRMGPGGIEPPVFAV